MNNQTDWNARLLQIAKEHPDATGQTGEILRAALSREVASEFSRDLQLAHARIRESVITGVQMSLRCGALLINAKASMKADDYTKLLRVACISPEAAEAYMLLAFDHNEFSQLCLRRKGRISEADALNILRGSNPVANLQTIANYR